MTQADLITLLKKQIADETAEKYDLYKRIKELKEENEKLKEQLNKKDG